MSAPAIVSPARAAARLPEWLRGGRPGLLIGLVLAVVLGVSAALRLYDLADRSLWVDELFSVGLAAQDLPTILTVLYGEEANMTLYYLLMAVWVRLVGGSADEFWMRLPSVVFGVAGLWALYRLGARLDRPSTGLLAAALAAVNAYHIEMSQEARAYTLWALLATLSWDALVEALDDGQRATWLRYVVWTALAFYAHFFSAFVVLAQVAVVAVRMRSHEWRALIASGVGVAVLCLPFLPFFIVNNDGSQILHVRRSDLKDLFDLLGLFAGSSTSLLVAYGVLGALGVGLSVRNTVQAGSRAAVGRALIPLLWLLVPVLTIFLVSYVKPMFKERYLFAAMPAFPLLIALGIMALRPILARPLVALGVAVLAIQPITDGLEIRQSENWRGAVAYLQENAQDDDGWIFISKRGQLGYEYYAGWLGGGPPGAVHPSVLEPFDWRELAVSEEYYRALDSGTSRLPEFTARHPRIWLVLSHEFDSTFDGDTSEEVRGWLSRRGFGARQRSFQNVRVLLYQRRS